MKCQTYTWSEPLPWPHLFYFESVHPRKLVELSRTWKLIKDTWRFIFHLSNHRAWPARCSSFDLCLSKSSVHNKNGIDINVTRLRRRLQGRSGVFCQIRHQVVNSDWCRAEQRLHRRIDCHFVRRQCYQNWRHWREGWWRDEAYWTFIGFAAVAWKVLREAPPMSHHDRIVAWVHRAGNCESGSHRLLRWRSEMRRIQLRISLLWFEVRHWKRWKCYHVNGPCGVPSCWGSSDAQHAPEFKIESEEEAKVKANEKCSRKW